MKWPSESCPSRRIVGTDAFERLARDVPAPSRERVGVPASLDGLVAKLLEKDPAKRPQSASEVARELSAIADRIDAPPPRFRLRPVFAIPAIVLLLLLAAGGFGSISDRSNGIGRANKPFLKSTGSLRTRR